MKKNLVDLIIILAWSILIVGLIIGAIAGVKKFSQNRYNHGICPKCNIEYQVQDTILRGTDAIHYHCEKCGKSGTDYKWNLGY